MKKKLQKKDCISHLKPWHLYLCATKTMSNYECVGWKTKLDTFIDTFVVQVIPPNHHLNVNAAVPENEWFNLTNIAFS